MDKIFNNILETIGKTPLIKLSKIAAGLPVIMLAKVEYLNPGGSVKDRIGRVMIEDAERRGVLKPGGTIIEATAGNTGTGLALAAAVKGYRCVFVLPDKMSKEKIDLLKAYGAEIIITPTSVPPDSAESYNGVAERLAREIPGSFSPHQFANPGNPNAHYQTTGPEIWEDTGGRIDVFVAGMGTGGTISGVGKYLKERNPKVVIVGADPEGSILSGDSPRPYKVEGIGEDFVPATFNRQVVDEMIRVSDAESFSMARRLAREEGLLVGGSAGTAVVAALKFAERLEPGKVMVTLLPDTGRNYLSKIFSDQWMEENGFLQPLADRVTARQVMESKKSAEFYSVLPSDRLVGAVELMEEHHLANLAVVENGEAVGNLSQTTLMRLYHQRSDLDRKKVSEIMAPPLPQVNESVSIGELYRLLLAGGGEVLIMKGGIIQGTLTPIDLIRFYHKKP